MSNKLLEIEQVINSLSLDDQKWLLKRLTQQVNQKMTMIFETDNRQHDLEIMANDPEIKREIASINEEFIVTQMDGIDY